MMRKIIAAGLYCLSFSANSQSLDISNQIFARNYQDSVQLEVDIYENKVLLIEKGLSAKINQNFSDPIFEDVEQVLNMLEVGHKVELKKLDQEWVLRMRQTTKGGITGFVATDLGDDSCGSSGCNGADQWDPHS